MWLFVSNTSLKMYLYLLIVTQRAGAAPWPFADGLCFLMLAWQDGPGQLAIACGSGMAWREAMPNG